YEVPEDFERIVRKCLAKSPQERYQDTRDLLVDIRAVRRRVEHESYSQEHRAPESAPARLKHRRLVVAAGTVAPAVSALSPWKLLYPPNPPVDRMRNLVVSTFQNLNGNADLEYFSRGLTETLVARLSGLKGFYVTSSSEDAGADLLLQGGVQRSSETV